MPFGCASPRTPALPVLAGVVLMAALVATAADAQSATPRPGATAIPAPGSVTASPDTAVTVVTPAGTSARIANVTGSASGDHVGEVSQVRGGTVTTFDPAMPFVAGEVVTVTTDTPIATVDSTSWEFIVATPAAHPGPLLDQADSAIQPDQRAAVAPVTDFVTRPDLQATTVTINRDDGPTAPGYLFATPTSTSVTDGGIQIYDDAGELVWFKPQPGVDLAANAVVERYAGQPVLAWFRGDAPYGAGNYRGEWVVVDSSYRNLATIRMGNGYQADVHDLDLTDDASAYMIAYNPVVCSGAAPLDDCTPGATIFDAVLQEVDIASGAVMWEWHSTDHVDLSDSYVDIRSDFVDYLHPNSIALDTDGQVLLSGRHTSALYKIDRATGEVIWIFGGKSTSFPTLVNEPNTITGPDYPHHFRAVGADRYTYFDNGVRRGGPSRGAEVDLDPATGTATYTTRLVRNPALFGPTQGSMQELPGGGHLVAWGGLSTLTEYSGANTPVFDASLDAGGTYRQFRFEWTGMPVTRPAVAVTSDGGGARVAVSWNGDTRTASWRVLSGSSTDALSEVTTVARDGFETITTVPGAAWFAVEALDGGGQVLARSEVVRGASWFRESAWRRVSGDYVPIVGDFGASRNDDIFWYQPGAGPEYLHLSDGDGGSSTMQAPSVNGSYEPVVADVVGDDRDEVVWTQPGTPRAFVWRFDGAPRGGTPVVSSARMGAPSQVSAVVVLDNRVNFGGSIHDELLWYAAGSAPDRVDRFSWPSGSTMDVTSRTASIRGRYEPVSGDFDGNGLGDVLWYAAGSAPDHVWFSEGGAEGSSGQTSMEVSVSGDYDVLAGNFSGDDRRDELVFRAAGPASDHLWEFSGRRRRTFDVSDSSSGSARVLHGGNDRLLTWRPGRELRVLEFVDRTGAGQPTANTALGGSYQPLVGDFVGPGGTSSVVWYAPGSAAERLFRG